MGHHKHRLEVQRCTGVLPITSCAASVRYSWEVPRWMGATPLYIRALLFVVTALMCMADPLPSSPKWALVPRRALSCLTSLFTPYKIKDSNRSSAYFGLEHAAASEAALEFENVPSVGRAPAWRLRPPTLRYVAAHKALARKAPHLPRY